MQTNSIEIDKHWREVQRELNKAEERDKQLKGDVEATRESVESVRKDLRTTEMGLREYSDA